MEEEERKLIIIGENHENTKAIKEIFKILQSSQNFYFCIEKRPDVLESRKRQITQLNQTEKFPQPDNGISEVKKGDNNSFLIQILMQFANKVEAIDINPQELKQKEEREIGILNKSYMQSCRPFTKKGEEAIKRVYTSPMVMKVRNKHMAKRIFDVLEQRQERIIVLCGAKHLMYDRISSSLLQEIYSEAKVRRGNIILSTTLANGVPARYYVQEQINTDLEELQRKSGNSSGIRLQLDTIRPVPATLTRARPSPIGSLGVGSRNK